MSAYLPYLNLLATASDKDGQPLYVASPDDVAAFLPKVRNALGADLPTEYAAFLGEADGFAYDGSCFYAVDEDEPDAGDVPGLIRENVNWGIRFDASAGHIVLGHSDLWLYAYHPDSKTFHALWKDRRTSVRQFQSFDEMMVNALKEALGIPLDEESPE
jgi:hypothetical protein